MRDLPGFGGKERPRPRRRTLNSHPEVEEEDSKPIDKLQVTCNGPNLLGTYVRPRGRYSPRRSRSSLARVSSSTASASRDPRSSTWRGCSSWEANTREERFCTSWPDVPRTAKS